MNLRPVSASDAPGCDAVIASLPYFFGDPDGIRERAEAVRTQPGWVVEDAGVVVGFVTLRYPFPRSPEISWLAVRDERRRSGIGRQLVERASAKAARDGAEVLSVLTLGPSVPEPGVVDGYAGTRSFYGRVGFVPVGEVQPESWNSGPALLLVRCLHCPAPASE
jgi:N-acetylglutamate synthase-like GNAT family acetyltransferase